MGRGVWFLAGTAAGAYAVTRARRTAEAFTMGGMHDRMTGWFAGARVLADEAGTARAEKRAELQERVAARTARQLEETPSASVTDHPSDNVRQLKR